MLRNWPKQTNLPFQPQNRRYFQTSFVNIDITLNTFKKKLLTTGSEFQEIYRLSFMWCRHNTSDSIQILYFNAMIWYPSDVNATLYTHKLKKLGDGQNSVRATPGLVSHKGRCWRHNYIGMTSHCGLGSSLPFTTASRRVGCVCCKGTGYRERPVLLWVEGCVEVGCWCGVRGLGTDEGISVCGEVCGGLVVGVFWG